MSDKVGIGFIGSGFARTVQMPAFREFEGARLVSVSSGHLENAEAAARQFEIPHFSDDWRQTIEHPEVDLVCITTPPNLHHEMVMFAVAAGKHILAEKPMAMNLAEAEEMAAAAAAGGKLALIDHELRFQRGRQKARAMLHQGEIGMVRHAKYNFRAPHRGDTKLPWTWWSDIEAGGGALGAINSHVIDSFNWFLAAEISSVFCQLQTHVKERPNGDSFRQVTTDDEANMLLRFADGPITKNTTGLVSVSMVEQPEYLNRIEFFGTLGAMRIDQRGEVFVAKNGEEWRQAEADIGRNPDGAPDTGFARGFVEFAPLIVDAIRTGSSFIEHAATFEDGVKVQRVLDAARASDRTGTVVTLG